MTSKKHHYIGQKLVGKAEGWVVGGSVQVKNESWPIVGVFSAAGSALEGEVWGDRVRLGIALTRPMILCAVVRARTLEEVASLATAIAKLRLEKGSASAIWPFCKQACKAGHTCRFLSAARFASFQWRKFFFSKPN